MFQVYNYFNLYLNNVDFSSYRIIGTPKFYISKGGVCVIGKQFSVNDKVFANPIGRYSKCTFVVRERGKLKIGFNVGISFSTIVCHNKITIGNNVKIGGNSVIYDTDFHSLNYQKRQIKEMDIEGTKTKPVILEDNVFIGAHSTILKGVTIGENSIVGACSVVTKDIPKNEIWGGNPAKFIRRIV
ncbi:acyltransferase [Seonamhaeicola aphaedonensis]|nr:acyltransferase [Seonamhaeicola aphaedonensis]